jgi:hypothetical protein
VHPSWLSFCAPEARAEDDPRLRTDIDKELAQQLYRELPGGAGL